MTRVAVTGASGFVGRHIVRELERRDVALVLVCRPGSPRLVEWSARHRVVFLDVSDRHDNVYERLEAPDALIHLAWAGLPHYDAPHHLEQVDTHIAFLGRLIASGLPALTVTGTCLEYGLQSGELDEGLPTAPVTSYGEAKDALRRALERMEERSSLALTWARLFYVYGEGQAEGSLIPQLERAIDRGDAVFDMSGGEQVRDYLPIEVAAWMIAELALNGRDNGIVNVCSGQPITVREVVEQIVSKRRSSIRLNPGHYPYPEYEPMAFWGSRRKLDSCLERAG